MQHPRWPAAITAGGEPLLLANVVEPALDDIAFLPVIMGADSVFIEIVGRIPAPDATGRVFLQDSLVACSRVLGEQVSPIIGKSAVGIGVGSDAGRENTLAVGDGCEFDLRFGECWHFGDRD